MEYLHQYLVAPPYVCIDSEETRRKRNAGKLADLQLYCLYEARWPSGRTSDSGARGRGFDPHIGRHCFCSKTCFLMTLLKEMYVGFQIQRQGSSCMF